VQVALQVEQTLGPVPLFVYPYVPAAQGLTQDVPCKNPILDTLSVQTVQVVKLTQSEQVKGHCEQLVLLLE